MGPNVFRHLHRVTYAECTVGNHIYYSRYLDILEAARGEFFRQIGQPFARLQQEDIILPVTEVRLRYKGAARYDDVLTVEVRVAELARVRVAFSYAIFREPGSVLVEAVTVHACASTDDKLKRLPADLCAALRRFVETPADERVTG